MVSAQREESSYGDSWEKVPRPKHSRAELWIQGDVQHTTGLQEEMVCFTLAW